MTARAAALVALLALAACSSPPMRGLFETSKGSSVLSAALREYDNGDYAEAGKDFQIAIDLGLTGEEEAMAHKHLAFIHCASGRDRLCREEFRRALTLKPDLELSAAEAGHSGSGLGLYTARGIARLHGGDVRRLDGDRFEMELPLAS